jgi:hypothetical protein
MDNELLQRTSTELQLCVLYRCRVSNFTRQHLTRMVFPWPPAEPHLYVVSGRMEGVVRPWRNAESMHTTLVMTRRDC